ncbi:GDP-mannose pyrophosphatase NudK [Flavobacterium sp. Sd200]|uniref:GDP-mannose pyrophosphatase NudK n=1 Tax=Flavobacterium sp. Sd200 TaxID=2692211 RepID=UPI001369DE51|nr:GDP-mannose pyrophosphatase NudK [Flavobacterium sp. Sd200]MXN92497.1 GDP-mannose pyrophosphatase NudK [Flavobacterium sp. Sd200]
MEHSIKILSRKLLSDNWATLHKVEYVHTLPSGKSQNEVREVYDRGNGAAILLYNIAKGTVILTRQLRIATWYNGNTEGLMIEACAGLLDEADPEDCIRRETEEETGYTLTEVTKVMEAYMSPGSVSEILYFFIAAYSDAMKTGEGGGLDSEQENIEVLEISFNEALAMIKTKQIKDAKTIMLLQYLRLEGIL